MITLAALAKEYRVHTSAPPVVMPGLPTRYMIEPTNFCNLSCPICYTNNPDEEDRSLTTAEFVRIADQIPTGSHISFYDWGEPFLNPDTIPIIREAAKRDLKMTIHSNMNIDPDLLPQIVDSGLTFLSASIDGARQETYVKFRKKGNFDEAYGNLKKLAELKAEKGIDSLTLRWQFIVNRYNENDVETARKMAAALPGNVIFSTITMGMRREKVEWDQYSDEDLIKLGEKWLPRGEKYLRRSEVVTGDSALIADARCPWLWESMVISVDGRVTPCCHTYKPEHSFGNLADASLAEIWNNEAYQSSRKMFLDPDDTGCDTICSRCPNYSRIKQPGWIAGNVAFLGWVAARAMTRLGQLLGRPQASVEPEESEPRG